MPTSRDVLLFKRKTAPRRAKLGDFADYVDRCSDVEQLKMRIE